jgi:hypothetical protein
MKRNLKILSVCIVALVALVVADRITATNTTGTMRQFAQEYLEVTDKQVPPRAFISDGCTLFPESILGSDWGDACLAHDIAYWAGGTKEERVAADTLFKDSVAQKGLLGKFSAPIMYVGVRLFGDTWLTKIFDANWGFGWNT